MQYIYGTTWTILQHNVRNYSGWKEYSQCLDGESEEKKGIRKKGNIKVVSTRVRTGLRYVSSGTKRREETHWIHANKTWRKS
jgi:hypothetical protein